MIDDGLLTFFLCETDTSGFVVDETIAESEAAGAGSSMMNELFGPIVTDVTR